MLSNQSVTNEKPRNLDGTKSQGGFKANSNSNSTTFNDSKSRYEKGMGLYKSSRVSIGSNGLFKVSGYYDVDTERMTCTCPDYKTRKEACKHLFAAMLFVKNRGKQRIEDLEGFNGNGNGSHKDIESVKEPAPKPQEAHSKDFDRQSTITRLAVLNTATEILKTHRKPIEITEVVSIASQLEKWALGN